LGSASELPWARSHCRTAGLKGLMCPSELVPVRLAEATVPVAAMTRRWSCRRCVPGCRDQRRRRSAMRAGWRRPGREGDEDRAHADPLQHARPQEPARAHGQVVQDMIQVALPATTMPVAMIQRGSTRWATRATMSIPKAAPKNRGGHHQTGSLHRIAQQLFHQHGLDAMVPNRARTEHQHQGRGNGEVAVGEQPQVDDRSGLAVRRADEQGQAMTALDEPGRSCRSHQPS